MKGKLFLIPTPIGGDPLKQLPKETLSQISSITYFIAERARTARRFLQSAGYPLPISEAIIREIPKKQAYTHLVTDLAPLKDGISIGLLSEAGSPGIADPGSEIVRKAHEWGIQVIPLTGPSSLLLALMASGLNGQKFSFHGYLSPKKELIGKDLRRLENSSKNDRSCHFFIEAPYRNMQVFQAALDNLQATTLFSVQCELNTSDTFSKTLRIEEWRKQPSPDLHKRPCVFLLQS
ncbi:MAG: SAM-dependent methyltransferase [Saprospirales bacterium]|nr:MAG: SAM-dependent methyltransferase [Saprospirales bacterium]